MPGPSHAGRYCLDTPSSPVSISTDSSRHASQRHVPAKEQLEQPTPSSPRMRLTRKRAASLNTDNANEPRIADLALDSASTTGNLSDHSTREQVCLCQPDPKIPRPRNAFILYRQHYQAQVVAQNPGLANPEISKIIGEQWRAQEPEVKSNWKRLAEEEKQRHQRQYPGYRYQPRRAGKANGSRPTPPSLSEDPTRCPKCNGRYISTPSTPSTPFTPGFGAVQRSERLLPPFTPPPQAEIDYSSSSASMQSSRTDPRTTPLYQQTQRRGVPYPTPQPLHAHTEREDDIDLMSPSPGKRRRFNEENQRGYAANSPISYSGSQQYNRGSSLSTGYRQSPSGTASMSRPGSMGPPTQGSPSQQQARHPYPTRSNTFDESLRLPPLQTQVTNSTPTATQRPDARTEARETQARSVEAMVMTIPFVNKIKVLMKISPPLAPPGPTSPAQETRGAVIAVEGADKELLAEVGTFIKNHLSTEPSFAIKTWRTEPTSPKSTKFRVADVEMTDAPEYVEEKEPFVDYLSVISEWHKKSRQMIKYITTFPHAPSGEPSSSASLSASNSRLIPIALATSGYSLTVSDSFALRIPINDSYAPVDHWQWMATLWRGIVGPDLTIYVARVSKDEMAKYGAVDCRPDCPAIIVRILEGVKMDEKTSRRLGFEVLEFVRNMDNGFSRN